MFLVLDDKFRGPVFRGSGFIPNERVKEGYPPMVESENLTNNLQ